MFREIREIRDREYNLYPRAKKEGYKKIKPQSNITEAEAEKIILEIFEEERRLHANPQ